MKGGGIFEESSCAIPLIFYVCLSIIAIIAFPVANSWKWPLMGYASAGLIALSIICSLELTFLKWFIVSLPIMATIIAIIWIILCRAYDNVIITPTESGVNINIYEHEQESPCGCNDNRSCHCDEPNRPPHVPNGPYPVMPYPQFPSQC